MFTGIVTAIGTIESIIPMKKGIRMEVLCPLDLKAVKIGASIACSGVCLTMVEKKKLKNGWSFAVECSYETLEKTNFSNIKAGSAVNLETSLKLGDELGGHFVFGHVDGVTSITKIKQQGDYSEWAFALPRAFRPFIVEKGSVCLDGVSLTVNKVSKNEFKVTMIPHTQEKTTFKLRNKGDSVNLEIDMLARYVAKQLKA